MSMRGSPRRARESFDVSPRAFGWDRYLVATLRHVSLPWSESLAATPLVELANLGSRDRLSLLAQFAAHQALLQFAGIADGELDPAEWAVVQKRGSDVRLVRLAARAPEVATAPPALTLAQQFAEVVGAELDVLRQSWARAETVYAEAHARLRGDVAADLRWMRRAACGSIDAPGPEGLRLLTSETRGRFGYTSGECVQALERLVDPSLSIVVLRGASPLERYSALRALDVDPSTSEAAIAERIVAATSGTRHLFVVANLDAFDGSSRRVVDILTAAEHATWLLPQDANLLPETRRFVVSTSLTAREALQVASIESFVESDAYAAYLDHGDVPATTAALPSLVEPARSYVGALALLGTRIPRELASRFLAGFLFNAPLEELVVNGATSVEDEHYVFASEAVRAEAARLIPNASRAAICGVAASLAEGVRAAQLWIDAGEPARAAVVLEATEWSTAEETVAALRRVPEPVLTPPLARRYAHALIDSGRYRTACDVAGDDPLVLARAERRMGDYATALTRLERVEPSFDAQLLRAELLRLNGQPAEAVRVLTACMGASDEESVRLDYERALHGLDVTMPAAHYLTARLATYRVIERHAYDEAAAQAVEAIALARCATERIDARLDRLFATFSGGRWDEARALALEALQELEETQGDRAAGGILFLLAYLAADDGQWAHASQRLARLRHYYGGARDELRLRELDLLAGHLDFSRGRFADARRAALAVCEHRVDDAIREAAALIVDEVDWLEGRPVAWHSTGRCGNVELERRARALRRRVAGQFDPDVPPLVAFRDALAQHDRITAQRLAREHGLTIDTADDSELRVLRTAATREFPFAPHDFETRWCFATRNRLGQWSVLGSHQATNAELEDATHPDWIECSERELLFLEGSSRWSADAREAVAAVFRTRAENHRLRRVVEQEESSRPAARADAPDGIVGDSPVMREVYALVTRVARRDVPVCILGESGTGKELIARALHRHSPRRPKSFTAVNCAALPENLIESELFGHVRGAFTGADRDRAGLIETTDGGTLFLDEIGELPLTAQAKLLRFLQEGEFRRVGDTTNRSADVRIVSATNRKLETAVEQGQFRDDLYYRIRGVEIALPSLRERPGDIPLLAEHFLRQEREKHRGGATLLSNDAEAVFVAYPWPGNVRELQNTIRAAHAMAGDAKEIAVEHLPERLRGIAPARIVAGSYQDSVARFKRDLIERSLVQVNGNQNRAAAMLKISRQALAYQIRELGIMVKTAGPGRL